ncbi:YbaB/EbfC family nucleoid-associated protein [Glycomyces luteolus]|uniref:YbaB/EbfC family nucleoid-associated protein n=1 Tax=Glycomyces luteolus TaxID=2670330 RepID=A0A9X3PHJ0_9ACTN|nr:YbaB/EbfC family nucleoid-associated protein [Glycomyces luteolus]MDA1358655.1 YbaB/EbfC family nucleoid-associated protein [Glycomyces luteolus]
MTAPDLAAAIGAWASRARAKVAESRAARAEAFPGFRFESGSGAIAIDIGPNLELRSCEIHPAGYDIRDVLEREFLTAYNSAFTAAQVQKAEAMRDLAAARRNGG